MIPFNCLAGEPHTYTHQRSHPPLTTSYQTGTCGTSDKPTGSVTSTRCSNQAGSLYINFSPYGVWDIKVDAIGLSRNFALLNSVTALRFVFNWAGDPLSEPFWTPGPRYIFDGQMTISHDAANKACRSVSPPPPPPPRHRHRHHRHCHCRSADMNRRRRRHQLPPHTRNVLRALRFPSSRSVLILSRKSAVVSPVRSAQMGNHQPATLAAPVHCVQCWHRAKAFWQLRSWRPFGSNWKWLWCVHISIVQSHNNIKSNATNHRCLKKRSDNTTLYRKDLLSLPSFVTSAVFRRPSAPRRPNPARATVSSWA